jgi:hypothetical protein
MSTMKKQRTERRKRESGRIKQQAISLDRGIAALFRRYKLEPGVAAGSPYANLHANDVGLLVALASEEGWHVRRVAQMLGAPMTTVSSRAKFTPAKWRCAPKCSPNSTSANGKRWSALYCAWPRPADETPCLVESEPALLFGELIAACIVIVDGTHRVFRAGGARKPRILKAPRRIQSVHPFYRDFHICVRGRLL